VVRFNSSGEPERVVLLAAVATVCFLFVWFQWELIFLAFAGLLCAILLHAITTWIERKTPLGPGFSYFATLLLLAALLAGAAVLIVPRAISQLSQLATIVPQSVEELKNSLQHRMWGRTLLSMMHRASNNMDLGAKVKAITSAASSAVVDMIVVAVIGFFGALNPRGYKDGLFALFPEQYRARAREIATELVERLRWWLLGQMVPMAVLGIACMVSLWLLGVPLAFTLGLLTGVMVFVPYAGTILSGIPCVLMALQRGPRTALYVLILFSVFHVIEGYLLTPLVQKKAVRLPPVLTVLAQFFLWSFAGVLGVAIAAPLTAAGMVLTNELYLKPRESRASARLEHISHSRVG
jgi:predicted PurR-regulated permease PerM